MSFEEAKFIVAFKEQRKDEKEKKPIFNLERFCTLPDGSRFTHQYDFLTDPARFKTFYKSRRAGGTMALAGLFLFIGSEIPDINLAYITLDRMMAERIIWPELIKLNQKYQLGGKPNQQKLWIEFPNGSYLYLMGAKDRNEINKARGKAFYLVGLDECQSFRNSIMEELIDDVLEAALIDYGGSLYLVGTPNAACRGYFFDACHSQGYKHFHWTMIENPWIAYKAGRPVEDIQKEHLERKGITEDDPTYQREWQGKWVKDEHSIIFKFKEDRNYYDELPNASHWYYVLGADIGWHDSDALVVWAFASGLSNLYCVHSEENQHEDISAFAHRVRGLEKKYGGFSSRVIDSGGLGKKITEELKGRHGLYFKPAEKTRKYEFIRIMNTDFNQGVIKAKRGTPVIEEWKINQWNTDLDPPKEDERFSNDMSDAALYSYREAKHYTYEKKDYRPPAGSKGWEKDMWKGIGKRDKVEANEEWWEK